jgi:DNA modification methylase
MTFETVTIGGATLYRGDCLEVLPTLGKFDAVITDPPYGIGADKGKQQVNKFKGGKAFASSFNPENTWDDSRPNVDLLKLVVDFGGVSILWGGNYFADLLPPQGKWLWWDKCQTMPTFGDGELAWTNLKGTTPKKFVWANNKILADRIERHHPTQKPLELMRWCIEQAGNPQTILDPFMGSGTTGVAAIQLGRTFTGIEREAKYFDIACKRIEQAYAQGQLFEPVRPKQIQDALI